MSYANKNEAGGIAMKKRLLLTLLSVMTVLVLAACGSSNDEGTQDEGTKDSDSKKVLKVGMEAAYAPFNWTQNDDSNGAVPISGTTQYAAGYDVEIAKRIAEGLGMELEIVKTKWEG